MDIFDNVWLKKIGIVLSCIYTAFLTWLAYASLCYRVTYTNKPVFTFVYVAVTLIFLFFMIFSRKSKLTVILTMIMMVLMLPVVLFNFRNWIFIIPPAITVLTMFFACGASEKLKTILGTIFLLMYIVCGLGFFLYINVLSPKTSKTMLEEKLSPNESYRYIIYDVKDNGSGKTEVYVEPADKDIDLKIVQFKLKGVNKCVYRVRNHEKPDVQWSDSDSLYINGERYTYEIEGWNLFEVLQ